MAVINYPLIAIVGPSGSGKSYSLKDLDPTKTKILNIERKPFPFKHGFKYGPNDIQCEDVQTFESKLELALKDTTCDVIVIESLTKYFEMLLDLAKRTNKGYDIYNFYNAKVGTFLERIKSNKGKMVVCLAIDEIVKTETTSGGEIATRRIKVGGKQWEGSIEKEFTIVLYTDVKQEKGKLAEHRFMVNSDGSCSAKSPPDMFNNQQFIPNNTNTVINTILGYYELKKTSTTPEPTVFLEQK